MELVACATCGGERTTPVFSKWGFHVVRCRNCGLCYVNPRAFNVEQNEYFEGPYLANIEESGTLRSGIRDIYASVLEHLGTYLEPGTLLDVGCGMGHFMVEAQNMGWKCHGAECSTYAAKYGGERWQLRIDPVCDLREARLPANHFDACVMIEAIEHLPFPKVTLTEVFRLLKPGGMVYLTAPNFGSFRALLEREEWKPVIPTGHLYYFTADSLSRMLHGVGFERLVNLTPPASFETEMTAIRAEGQTAMTESFVEAIQKRCAAEDANKLTNGRSERLVLCALKPRSRGREGEASLRFTDPTPLLDGQLLASAGDTLEDQKVYLINDGLKHWVTSVDWLTRRGRSLSETTFVERELLRRFIPGAPLM